MSEAMTTPSDEEALAELAAELAEHLRFEHDTGSIGVLEVAASRLGTGVVGAGAGTGTGPGTRTGAGPGTGTRTGAGAGTGAARGATTGTRTGASLEPDTAPRVVVSMGEVDDLLAAARRARAPARQPAEPTPSAEPAPPPRPIVARAPRVDDGRLAVLSQLASEAAACTACRLHESRTKSVFARGTPDADVVFVGEGPGFNEDKQGEPFVGAAGQLLDKMIGAMGLSRDGVYVCNVVKCRPPENRTPQPDEAAACARFLDGQLGAIKPRIVVALGRCAAERLGCVEPGRTWRGTWGEYQGVPVMPTYHPAYLLRNAEMKRPVWEDLQKVVSRLAKQSSSGAAGGEP